MKRIALLIINIILIMNILSMNVYAKPFNPNDYTSVTEYSELLSKNSQESRVSEHAKRRGDFFMGADLAISNEGAGDIGAVAIAYMALPADEVYITVYLDRWDEAADRWRQITYYDAEFYAKDYPDGLDSPSVNITFKSQPKGYYRLRGVFAAVLNDNFEGFSPTTAGILIE